MDWKLNKSTSIGKVAELTFEILCYRLGIEAAKNLNDIAPYDYLICLNETWQKIQVKTIYATKGYISKRRGREYLQSSQLVVRLFRHGRRPNSKNQERRYKVGDFNYLFATTGTQSWLLPYEVVANRWLISLNSKKYDQYKFPRDIGV